VTIRVSTLPATLRAPVRPVRASRAFARAVKGFAGVALLLVAWQLSVPLVGMDAYFYPAPTDVAAAFVDLVR